MNMVDNTLTGVFFAKVELIFSKIRVTPDNFRFLRKNVLLIILLL